MKLFKNQFAVKLRAFLVLTLLSVCSQSYAQDVMGFNSEFVKYTFYSGKDMNYEQTYRVAVTMKNIGTRTWDAKNNTMALVPDAGDINWRPRFSSPLFNNLVEPGQTVDIVFSVTPKACFFIGFPCYSTSFKFKLNAWNPPYVSSYRFLFGAFTPDPGLKLRQGVMLPTNPPANYTGMVLVLPPGTPPTVVPNVTFPDKL